LQSNSKDISDAQVSTMPQTVPTLIILLLIVTIFTIDTHAQVTVRAWSFENLERGDVIFNDLLLFDMTSSPGRGDCARRCGLTPSCVAFTFTERSLRSRSCRGHSNCTASTTSRSGTRAYVNVNFKLAGKSLTHFTVG
jgi:hypothetical protein